MDKKSAAAFERRVKKTVEGYGLADRRDRILVACSGGKDSTTVLYLLHAWGYDVEAITIDTETGDYSKSNIRNVMEFCRQKGIKFHLVSVSSELGVDMGNISRSRSKLSKCTVCGVVKRWALNKKAREIGATRLATGHNLNDESETVMMNLLKGNPELGINAGPKTGVCDDSRFVQRIKPLYFCTNEETKAYSEFMMFPVIYEPCPCSVGVFRRRVREQLKELDKSRQGFRLNLLENFLSAVEIMRLQKKEKGTTIQINLCERCGEPSREKLCRLCQML